MSGTTNQRGAAVGGPDLERAIEARRGDPAVFQVADERDAITVPLQRADVLSVRQAPQFYGVVEAGRRELVPLDGKRGPVHRVAVREREAFFETHMTA